MSLSVAIDGREQLKFLCEARLLLQLDLLRCIDHLTTIRSLCPNLLDKWSKPAIDSIHIESIHAQTANMAANSHHTHPANDAFGHVVPLLINGKEVTTKTTFDVTSPVSHHVIWKASSASTEDATKAAEAAQAAFPAWSNSKPSYRRDILLKASDILKERAEEVSEYMEIETGSTSAYAAGLTSPPPSNNSATSPAVSQPPADTSPPAAKTVAPASSSKNPTASSSVSRPGTPHTSSASERYRTPWPPATPAS